MPDESLIQRITRVLDELRPAIRGDGGDINFIRFHDGRVYIRMRGACVGCPMASYTLKMGIEAALKERITEVQEVIALDGDESDSL